MKWLKVSVVSVPAIVLGVVYYNHRTLLNGFIVGFALLGFCYLASNNLKESR